MKHNCTQCGDGQQIDCTTCKLAFLNNQKKANTLEQDEDYSISEQLTKKENDKSILYLTIVAIFVLVLVIIFSLLLR